MIPGSSTLNFYGVYMEIFKTKLGKKTSNFSIKCMMKFLGLFRVLDPKHPRLKWFKPNLSLKIYISGQVVFQKKIQKSKKNFFFQFFFQFFGSL
jgi:hypothetical protein